MVGAALLPVLLLLAGPETGKLRESVKADEARLRDSPDDADALQRLGMAYLSLEEPDRAVPPLRELAPRPRPGRRAQGRGDGLPLSRGAGSGSASAAGAGWPPPGTRVHAAPGPRAPAGRRGRRGQGRARSRHHPHPARTPP